MNAPLLLKAAFSCLSSVAKHTHTLPFCYHCYSLEVDLKQVRNGWLWFLTNSNCTNRQLHTFNLVWFAFLFQVDSEGQEQTQNIFKVCKSVHHHTFQINHPTRCNNFSSLLLDVYLYVQLNMFRVSSRPSSEAQQLQ